MFDFLKKITSYGKIEGYSVKLVDEFLFSVPADYNHSKQIDAFLKYAEKKNISYTSELSDNNFKHTSYQLEPCEQYHARILRVGTPSQNYGQLIKTDDCVSFLEKQNTEYGKSYFVGTQGLTYIWQFIKKESLESGHPILSMDEARFIAKNDDRITTLFLEGWGKKERASVKFTYGGKWYPGIYLLHVSKITETTKQNINESDIRKCNDNNIVYTYDDKEENENT
jgi:hypothetical protein